MNYGTWIKCPEDLQPGENEPALSHLYRKVWERFPGRPWTYAIRDSWHQYPLIWILLPGGFLVFLGCCLGHLFW